VTYSIEDEEDTHCRRGSVVDEEGNIAPYEMKCNLLFFMSSFLPSILLKSWIERCDSQKMCGLSGEILHFRTLVTRVFYGGGSPHKLIYMMSCSHRQGLFFNQD
jgi:hypothetical protein